MEPTSTARGQNALEFASAEWSRTDFWAIAILILCAWGLHGHGLTLGFWFDDHSHLELCQQNGFSDLAHGNRFDWNHRIAHAWWAKEETGWAYFRPLTVALRTSQYQLFGLNPLPFHVVHLALFTMSVVLMFGLLRRCGWSTFPATTAALFFILNPANSFTTPWLANDGPVLVGLWLVTGLWFMHASAQAGHRQPTLLSGVFVCYALAMLSRENGIMVGPLLVLFDWARAWRMPAGETSPSWLRRISICVGLAIEGVLYLILRSSCLGESPLPRSPYVHWPSEPGFLDWYPYKLLNELVCLPLGLPFMPIVEVPWWQARPVLTGLAIVAIGVITLVFLAPLWRSRLLWGVLAGIALAQAPTTIVFGASYNYYLATVGWALLLTAWARHGWPTSPRRVAAVTGMLAVWYLAGSYAGSWAVSSAATAERLVRADVLATHPESYPTGTRIFFINMPFFAAEAAPSIRLATGRADLEVYPLTFAPQPYYPANDVIVEIEDSRTLLVRSLRAPFFGGDFGNLVQLGWYGASRHDFGVGPVAIAPQAGPMPFRVEIVSADAIGISAVRFFFDRPLDDPGYRFFIGSSNGLATELTVSLGNTLSTLQRKRGHSDAEVLDLDRLRRTQIAVDQCAGLFPK